MKAEYIKGPFKGKVINKEEKWVKPLIDAGIAEEIKKEIPKEIMKVKEEKKKPETKELKTKPQTKQSAAKNKN